MLALARVASSSNSWSGQSKRTVSVTTQMVSESDDQDVRQGTCLEVQSPRCVFVELPDVGAEFDKGDEAAVVESVKAASEVYAPIGGEVTEINANLEEAPETVNASPDGAGWFLKMKISDADELSSLMDKAKYKEYCDGL